MQMMTVIMMISSSHAIYLYTRDKVALYIVSNYSFKVSKISKPQSKEVA
jgi:hypothetical protein